MTATYPKQPLKRGDILDINGVTWTVMHAGDVDGEERVLVTTVLYGRRHYMSGLWFPPEPSCPECA